MTGTGLRFHGAYIGTVVDNADPEEQGKVRVHIPGVHADDEVEGIPWARVCVLGVGQGQGQIKPPLIGVDAVVVFEQGRRENPLVVGVLATTLDTRNAGGEEYTAGPKTLKVEGAHQELSGGDRVVESNRNITLSAVGGIYKGARFISEQISGLYSRVANREQIRVGTSERTHTGVATWDFLSDLGITVGGNAVWSFVNSAAFTLVGTPLTGFKFDAINALWQARATAPGFIQLRVTPPIPDDPTGLTDLGTVRMLPVGEIQILGTTFVRVGRPATQGVSALPLATVLHTHIGNLGLPVSVLVPAPGAQTTSLLAE